MSKKRFFVLAVLILVVALAAYGIGNNAFEKKSITGNVIGSVLCAPYPDNCPSGTFCGPSSRVCLPTTVECVPGQPRGEVVIDKILDGREWKDLDIIVGLALGKVNTDDICCFDLNYDSEINAIDVQTMVNLMVTQSQTDYGMCRASIGYGNLTIQAISAINYAPLTANTYITDGTSGLPTIYKTPAKILSVPAGRYKVHVLNAEGHLDNSTYVYIADGLTTKVQVRLNPLADYVILSVNAVQGGGFLLDKDANNDCLLKKECSQDCQMTFTAANPVACRFDGINYPGQIVTFTGFTNNPYALYKIPKRFAVSVNPGDGVRGEPRKVIVDFATGTVTKAEEVILSPENANAFLLDKRVILSWSPVEGAVRYKYERYKADGTFSAGPAYRYASLPTVVSGDVPEGAYYYKIYAIDNKGQTSSAAVSNKISVFKICKHDSDCPSNQFCGYNSKVCIDKVYSCDAGQKIGDLDKDGLVDNLDLILLYDIWIKYFIRGLTFSNANMCCIDIDKDMCLGSADYFALRSNMTSPGVCTVIPNSCTDSDKAINIYAKGIVAGSLNGVAYSFTDSCASANSVREYYCAGTSYSVRDITCAFGRRCVDGACVSY